MKIPLWPSLEILEKHCRTWIRKKFGVDPFFPGMGLPLNGCYGDVTNIVFFGRLHDEIIDHRSWPGVKFRLWSLCSAGKEARLKVWNMPREEIGYLPRYELIPPALSPHSFPKLGDSWTLVYSGRVAREKGFAEYLQICSELQRLGEKVRPVVFGVVPINRTEEMKCEMKDFKKLISTLEWTTRPEMYIGMGPEDWLRTQLISPVLFNFTTFINEEFAVSTAQAQSNGWPVIISDWGAHKDVFGRNVVKLDVNRPITAEDLRMRMRNTMYEFRDLDQTPGQIIGTQRLEHYKNFLLKRGILPGKQWPKDVILETCETFGKRR